MTGGHSSRFARHWPPAVTSTWARRPGSPW